MRVNEENACTAATAHEDRQAKMEVERELKREAARQTQAEGELE